MGEVKVPEKPNFDSVMDEADVEKENQELLDDIDAMSADLGLESEVGEKEEALGEAEASAEEGGKEEGDASESVQDGETDEHEGESVTEDEGVEGEEGEEGKGEETPVKPAQKGEEEVKVEEEKGGEEEGDDEKKALREQVTNLQRLVNEVASGKVLGGAEAGLAQGEETGEEVAAEVKPAAVKPKVVEGEAEIKDFDFVGDGITEEAIYDPAALKGLINKAINVAYRAGVESSMRGVGDTIDKRIDYAVQMKSFVDEFYQQNTDLAPHKDYHQTVMRSIATNKPNATVQEMFDGAAEIVRKNMMLSGWTPPGEEEVTTAKVAQPGTTGTRKSPPGAKSPKPKDSRTDEEVEMDELNDLYE
jgi:hypothetical protein